MEPGNALTYEAAFNSEADLRAFAEAFGRCLHGGEIVGLLGTLGAGKTVFTQSLARGLDVPTAVPVVSPTFVLHRRYSGRCRLEHLDAYRLNSAAEPVSPSPQVRYSTIRSLRSDTSGELKLSAGRR